MVLSLSANVGLFSVSKAFLCLMLRINRLVCSCVIASAQRGGMLRLIWFILIRFNNGAYLRSVCCALLAAHPIHHILRRDEIVQGICCYTMEVYIWSASSLVNVSDQKDCVNYCSNSFWFGLLYYIFLINFVNVSGLGHIFSWTQIRDLIIFMMIVSVLTICTFVIVFTYFLGENCELTVICLAGFSVF